MEENPGTFEEKKDGLAEPEMTAAPDEGGRHPAKNRKKGWLIAGIAVGVLAAAYLGLGAWVSISQRIYPNTMIGGEDYGGMTQEQTAAELTRRVAAARSARVDFAVEDENGNEVIAGVDLGSVPDTFDSERYADAVYQLYGCTDNCLVSGAKYLRALVGTQYYMSLSVGGEVEASFEAMAREVCAALECAPVEFAISVTENGKVSVTKPMDGRHVADTNRAENAIVAALREVYFGGGETTEITLKPVEESGIYEVVPAQTVDLAAEREKLVGEKVNAAYDKESGGITPDRAGVSFTFADLQSAYDAAKAGETFTVAASVELPEVTAETLEKCLFRDELSSYTTRVGGAPGRHKNVQLTAERVNGYILNAGETMKYKPLVTPFTAANGYSPAPGYIQGKTVDMIGGGVCQTSSTLYAAVLYANLEIVQRVNHGFASDYIGLGLDATVAEGGPEFEFRNNTLYPIKVRAEFFTQNGKDYVKVTLLGTKTDDNYVKIRTDVLETIPFKEEIVETTDLAPGESKVEQTAYTGYKVKTYRNVYSGDGTLISSTFEASSNYKARNRIVLVGKSADGTAVPSGGTAETPVTPTSPDTPDTPDDEAEAPAWLDPVTPDTPAEETEIPGWLKPQE